MSAGPIARRTASLAAAAAGAAAAAAVLLRRRSENASELPSSGASSSGSPAADSTTAPPGSPDGQATGALDMNEASFEQLRGLGLSITQARRFLAVREERDGFESVNELDAVPGLPRDLRERLREQLRA